MTNICYTKTRTNFDVDHNYNYSGYSCDIIEEKTDEPIGNFTGLFNKDGQPLFRPKERIGFKTWK